MTPNGTDSWSTSLSYPAEALSRLRARMDSEVSRGSRLGRKFGSLTRRPTLFQDSFKTKSISKAPVKKESTRIREAFFDEFSTKVKAIESNVPIQLSGGFRSRLGMADAIESGTCDLLGIVSFSTFPFHLARS